MFLAIARSAPDLASGTRTKHGANRVAERLSRGGIRVDIIHHTLCDRAERGSLRNIARLTRGLPTVIDAHDA